MSTTKNKSTLGASKVNTSRSVTSSQVGIKPKPISPSSEFSKHLKGLQQQAEENIEDEYIKNLQQQIAYMELELKLLKEKEIEAKESVSQIDKFFNDGVPLNENILALKNQYNHVKKELENKLDDLNDKRLHEVRVAVELKNLYDRQKLKFQELTAETDAKDQEFTKQFNELLNAQINEKNRKIDLDKELKGLENQFQTKTDENLKRARELEKEAMLADTKKDGFINIKAKIHKDLEEKDARIKGLLEELREMRERAALNPELKFLETENGELKMTITRCEKEIFAAEMRVKEMQDILKERSREREREAEHKRALIAKITAIKNRIDEENRVNDLVIENKVKKKEEKEMKEIEDKIKDLQREKLVMTQRQKEKEDRLEEMGQRKVTQQKEILGTEQNNFKLEKEIKDKKERILDLKNKNNFLIINVKALKAKLLPLEAANEKIRKEIPEVETKNLELRRKIDHMQKLSELSLQIKNVNLEEIKLLNTSNEQVCNTINDLAKKWDMLQRFNKSSE